MTGMGAPNMTPELQIFVVASSRILKYGGPSWQLSARELDLAWRSASGWLPPGKVAPGEPGLEVLEPGPGEKTMALEDVGETKLGVKVGERLGTCHSKRMSTPHQE